MTRGFRTFLFMFFVAAFLVAAPAVVFYAQGYRLNWPLEPGKKPIVMTGGFFVKADPKQISVYVNGKLAKQTDFFFDSALVENLLPRAYEFEIKKNGYQSWKKNLEIKETQVVEAREITLFPENLKYSQIENGVAQILSAPDAQKIALRQNDGAGWNVKMLDTRDEITTKLAGQGNFSAKNPEFLDWRWNGQNRLEIIVKESKNATSTYAVAIDKIPAQISKISANVSGVSKSATSTIELAKDESGGRYYYLAEDGLIYKKNGNQHEPAIDAKIEIKPGANYELRVFNDFYFLKENSRLTRYDRQTKSFETLADPVSDMPRLSPDSKKIAYCTDSEIWTMFLEDKTNQPAAKAGDKLFLARFSEKVSNCLWFNSDYLVFAAGKNIKAVEIDSRDKTNLADLGDIEKISGNAPQSLRLFFNRAAKTIYLFNNAGLFRSDPVE